MFCQLVIGDDGMLILRLGFYFGCLQVLKLDESKSELRYFIHYVGWNSRYDEWIGSNAICGLADATPVHPGRTPKSLVKVGK